MTRFHYLLLLLLSPWLIIGWQWWNPKPPVVHYTVGELVTFAIVLPSQHTSLLIYGLYLDAGKDSEYRVLADWHRIPPRCREVVEGAGCLDWLEPGEKDWDKVLAKRPKKGPK